MAHKSPLKTGLERLTRQFKEAEKLQPEETLVLDAVAAKAVLSTLRAMSKLAGQQELELSILRDSEAGKQLRSTLENLATGELATMLDAAGSNVVRPNFRGK